MKPGKEEIPNQQLIFIIIGFLVIGWFNIPVGPLAKNTIWFVFLVALGAGIIFAYIYTALACNFPGKTLAQIHQMIYGPIIGNILSISYVLYFIFIASINVRFLSDFFQTAVMPDTPIIAFMVLFILLCASAVRNGIEVIGRCSIILVIIGTIVSDLTVLLLLKDYNWNNFLPIFNITWQQFMHASFIAAMIPSGEIVPFLMFLAFTKNPHNAVKSLSWGLILGTVFEFTLIARNIGTLGNTGAIDVYPFIQAIRQINIADVITRIDAFVIENTVAMMFIKVSVFYYAATLALAQTLGLRNYSSLTYPIGVIILNLSILDFEFALEGNEFSANIYPFFNLPFVIGIPLVSLFIVIYKKVLSKKDNCG